MILPAENTPEFKAFVDFERRMLWHKEHSFKGFLRVCPADQCEMEDNRCFSKWGIWKRNFPPEHELAESYNYGGEVYFTRPVTGAGIYLRHVWGTLVPAFYKYPEEEHTAYAYTWVYSLKNRKLACG